ncbi:hypothetical protein L1887_47748 [Cichorium endivia]|nr:hypothetical protein L1887_47748 [Cichorium endivia]
MRSSSRLLPALSLSPLSPDCPAQHSLPRAFFGPTIANFEVVRRIQLDLFSTCHFKADLGGASMAPFGPIDGSDRPDSESESTRSFSSSALKSQHSMALSRQPLASNLRAKQTCLPNDD